MPNCATSAFQVFSQISCGLPIKIWACFLQRVQILEEHRVGFLELCYWTLLDLWTLKNWFDDSPMVTTSCPLALRTYPPRFGCYLRRLHSRFIKEKVVKWDISDEIMSEPLETFFGNMPWGDLWHDADMTSVLQYLRGSHHLCLGHWRELFPIELWSTMIKWSNDHANSTELALTLVLNLGKGMAWDLIATHFVYPKAFQSKVLLGD